MKRKYEDGAILNEIFDRILETEIPTIEEQKYEDFAATASTSNQFNDFMKNVCDTTSYQLANNQSPDTIDTSNHFGSSREDINKTGKKFQWIPEEINYLENYILTIEKSPSLNRIAICLNHLRYEASSDVKQFFHPFHVENSDRLKNGFNVALKRIQNRE